MIGEAQRKEDGSIYKIWVNCDDDSLTWDNALELIETWSGHFSKKSLEMLRDFVERIDKDRFGLVQICGSAILDSFEIRLDKDVRLSIGRHMWASKFMRVDDCSDLVRQLNNGIIEIK